MFLCMARLFCQLHTRRRRQSLALCSSQGVARMTGGRTLGLCVAGVQQHAAAFTGLTYYGCRFLQLKPLYYLAVNLAARGFAVLAYDKRTCSGAVHPVCAYRTFCTSPGVPAGCMDIKNNSLYDFSNDAVASAQFLAAYPGVAASNMTIMGHSQGCTVSVQAASTITDLVQNVVLLMGDGRRPCCHVSLPLVQG